MGLTSRWILIVLILGWAVYAVTPISKSINLGLDLQGGMHIILDVDTDKAIEGKIDNAVMQIRKDLDSEKLAYTFVRKQNMLNLAIGLGENTSRDMVIKMIKEKYPYLAETGIDTDAKTIVFSISNMYDTKWRSDAVDQSIEVLRNRVDQFGVAEPLFAGAGILSCGYPLPYQEGEIHGTTKEIHGKPQKQGRTPYRAHPTCFCGADCLGGDTAHRYRDRAGCRRQPARLLVQSHQQRLVVHRLPCGWPRPDGI